MNKFLRSRSGQSTLEYVIVLMGIIGAVIAGLTIFAPSDGSRGLGQVFSNASTKMTTETSKIATIVNPGN